MRYHFYILYNYYIIMSVLFILSNIAVPFLILTYLSTIKVYQSNQFHCAKWFMLIIYTFVSNILFYYFLYDNKWAILFDLAIKLAIVFLPQLISKSIQKIIQAFHFQLIIEFFRSFIITNFFIIFCIIIQLIMKALNMADKLHLKQSVTNTMQKILNQYAAPSFANINIPVNKTFENFGVQCDILNMAQINQEKRQKQILKLQLSQKKILESNISNPTNYDSGNDSRYHHSKVTRIQAVHDAHYSGSGMKNKSALTIHRSSTDLGLVDSEDQRKIQVIQVKKTEIRKSQNRSRKQSKQFNKQKAAIKQEDQPSMILNKLDVSQYSDMFEGEQQLENEDRKLVTKVQTIIEIGGISSARLEIYNIQLYSNSQIRIVSLYGRQFERHKLISMKTLKHGYYELRLQGGKVESRKVKFRGSFEPFLKYLQPGN